VRGIARLVAGLRRNVRFAAGLRGLRFTAFAMISSRCRQPAA
jgi:hypothetical protein